MLEPVDEKSLLVATLPACDCVVRSASIRVHSQKHWLTLRLRLRGLWRTEIFSASDLAGLTQRLLVDFGFDLESAQTIVNLASGGN